MKNIVIVLFSIVLMTLVSFATSSYTYNPYILCSVYLLYVVGIIFLYKKKLNYKLPLITISTIIIIVLIIKVLKEGFLEFNISDFVFLFSVVVFYLIAVKFAKKVKYRGFFVFGFFVLNYILCFYIYFFADNYSNFGTYTGGYSYTIENTIIVKDEKDVLKQLDEDKVYVIDLWNKGCAICIRKFPKFEKLKNKYSDANDIEFIAVNIYRSENDIAYSQKLFDKKNLDFKTYYISEKEAEELKTEFFPTVIVIKNNEIIFRGHIETLNALRFFFLK